MQLLNLRTEFEECTNNYTIPDKGSSINKLKWFVENGHGSNSLRNGFDDAKQLAEKIIAEESEWQKKQKLLMHQQWKV